MASDVKLTKLADCAGCGAKVGAGQLAKLFEGFEQPHDPNLLVGFDRADDAAVYKVIARTSPWCRQLDFFPARTFPSPSAPSRRPTLSDIYAAGRQAKTALNIMAVPGIWILTPCATSCAALRRRGAGGRNRVRKATSIYDPRPHYHLAGPPATGASGPHPRNAGARRK